VATGGAAGCDTGGGTVCGTDIADVNGGGGPRAVLGTDVVYGGLVAYGTPPGITCTPALGATLLVGPAPPGAWAVPYMGLPPATSLLYAGAPSGPRFGGSIRRIAPPPCSSLFSCPPNGLRSSLARVWVWGFA